MVTAGGPTPDDESSPHEGRVIGRYLILDEIASGGMATVHLAHIEGDVDRFVAVKCMHAHYARDPDFVSMFLDEAHLCTRIRHENVVATIDVSQEHHELLLVLELVDGESLSRLIKTINARHGRVPQAIVSAIVRDMLAGLHAAHEATGEDGEALMIVHRDVSPHNVLVDTDGVAKVLDFGVAKARGRVQQTQKGQLKGKLAYMSPEQARGRNVDRRSDIFAAGIVLWEMLVGQRLFDGENEAALLVSLLTEKPSAPSKRDPALAKFDALVLRALSTEPDDRFSTAEEMAAAITALMPPASRAEVAAWVKGEAKSSLLRRTELLKRARARVAALRGTNDQDAIDDVPTRAVLLDSQGRVLGPAFSGLVPKLTVPLSQAAVTAAAQAVNKPAATGASEVDSILWDTSTTTSEVGNLTMAGGPQTEDPTTSSAERDPRGDVELRDATLPLYSPPAAFMAAAGIALGPTATPRPGQPALPSHANTQQPMPPAQPAFGAHPQAAQMAHQASFQARSSLPQQGFDQRAPLHQTPGYATAVGFPTEYESRAETIPSQVTSVTLTTTDLPPPLPAEHVRRLKLIAILSGCVGALAATALLVIMTRKPEPASPQNANSAVTVPMSTATTKSPPSSTASVASSSAASVAASETAAEPIAPTSNSAASTNWAQPPLPTATATSKATAPTPGGKGLLGPSKAPKR